jgi:Fic family protein
MIEGNRLTQEQVERVIGHQEHFPGRERDEKEVLGYYVALEKAKELAGARGIITETDIWLLHGLVMAGGRTKVKPTPYREGQNVIRNSRSRGIGYYVVECIMWGPTSSSTITRAT